MLVIFISEWNELTKEWQHNIMIIFGILAFGCFSEFPDVGAIIVNFEQLFLCVGFGFFVCAPVCYSWANEKGLDKNWAFVIGMYANVPGAVGYYIYKSLKKR